MGNTEVLGERLTAAHRERQSRGRLERPAIIGLALGGDEQACRAKLTQALVVLSQPRQ